MARNGAIGRDGGLPWHISSELKRFKAITMGKPIIMGRKTWDSLPKKPLPGRTNIVITRSAGFAAPGALVARDAGSALALASRPQPPEIMVIGGGEIYRLFWPEARRIYLTEVDMAVDGDTYFPAAVPPEWNETACELHGAEPGDTAGYTLRILDRRPPPGDAP